MVLEGLSRVWQADVLPNCLEYYDVVGQCVTKNSPEGPCGERQLRVCKNSHMKKCLSVDHNKWRSF